jgi:hypothetical protein
MSLLAACGLVAALTSPAAAQDAATNPNPGPVHVTGATDFTNAYMFRGIRQDDTSLCTAEVNCPGFKLLTWPYFDLGFALYSGDGALKTVAADIGTWNSLHPGATGSHGPSGKLWYESDFYATLGLGFGGGFSLGTTWTSYTSPNNMFTTVKEIAFKVAADDSAYLHKAAVKPYALVAFEVATGLNQGQADAGSTAGRYLELGVGPGYSWSRFSLAVPVKVGLSLSNYYELNEGTFANPVYVDHKFGYFSAAGVVTVPFTSTPSKFGSWNVHGGVEFQKLGDTTKVFNGGEDTKTIGTVGIGFSY